MSRFDWLTSRPIAHRGLHDGGLRIVENTQSAASAAIDHGYGIEVDLQITADGEAMVHHDDVLGRLTEGVGRLADMTAAQLKRIPFKSTADHMMTLGELCDLVGGRTLLLVEMKSAFDGDRRLARRTAQVLKGYAGPVAAMSFDPALVGELKHAAPQLTRGITAMGHYDDLEWAALSKWSKRAWPHLLPAIVHNPHFVAYALHDLPAVAATLARNVLGKPLLTWVARSEEDRRRASRLADQIIFEGFSP
jgi:glycerophosphoryl diester phosphodiesterase